MLSRESVGGARHASLPSLLPGPTTKRVPARVLQECRLAPGSVHNLAAHE
jgi:hypothetical protein